MVVDTDGFCPGGLFYFDNIRSKLPAGSVHLHAFLIIGCMKFLKKVRDGWMKTGLFMGNVMSGIFLTIFYFLIFSLFAIPFRIFVKVLRRKSEHSNWFLRKDVFPGMEDFRDE
ncbi:MAG: hypothetical protein UY23_C0001G0081 [Candidatus Jorgensenbacteria bacterium GW2011_GWA1_48_11]|uniref:Uncharacterized protein n=1 Tax=Candidatus Jorgensenbacteria bacterium GW2011_GWA1_48_11 TaxID=1618660 RepID=A0A0G1XAV8_9BACT|nr:MAG: hypothetical protein UY23_C0001G0081 [Candidatus Jorgensenbacteria bacterium GW2011_GWA1_48_11]KKW11968.1 MAG: hypothetical protein UY51_C0005G0210 [Candidatus Jorgensenbacteria bacterium GW2011_GWB1_49_9]